MTDDDIIAIQDYFDGKEIKIERKPKDAKEDIYLRVLAIIHKTGKAGAKESYVNNCCAAFRKMSAIERSDFLGSMVNAKDIKIIENLGGGGNVSKGGRAGRRFFIL